MLLSSWKLRCMRLGQQREATRPRAATVGGGMVDVTMNGRMELVSIKIDPLAVDSRDVEMLQDLIVAAVNQAQARAQEMAQQEMGRATGLPLGGLMGLFGGEK